DHELRIEMQKVRRRVLQAGDHLALRSQQARQFADLDQREVFHGPHDLFDLAQTLQAMLYIMTFAHARSRNQVVTAWTHCSRWPSTGSALALIPAARRSSRLGISSTSTVSKSPALNATSQAMWSSRGSGASFSCLNNARSTRPRVIFASIEASKRVPKRVNTS